MIRIFIFLAFLAFFSFGCGGGSESGPCFCNWKDYSGNPLIEPPTSEGIIADPTFLTPELSPDGKWHLFAHSLQGIFHFVSGDGLDWGPAVSTGIKGIRPYLYKEGDKFYLLDEKFLDLDHTVIEIRESADLNYFEPATTVLSPSFPWEKSLQETNGNPFLMKWDGKYWLYYSAGTVFLPDALYFEPTYIGLARADNLLGPYRKETEPLISPAADDPCRNLGAGSMKVLEGEWNGRRVGFNNGIYQDAGGNSRSAIMIISSADGLKWEGMCPGPIISPEPGWKQAFVYAFDVRRVGQELWLYYNARDGWFKGEERIGLSILHPPHSLEECLE